jgi:hypothetical protein
MAFNSRSIEGMLDGKVASRPSLRSRDSASANMAWFGFSNRNAVRTLHRFDRLAEGGAGV